MTDRDLQALHRQHRAYGALAAMAVAPLHSPRGIVLVNGDEIVGFQENPVLPHWIDAVIYAISPELITRVPDVGDREAVFLPERASARQLRSNPLDGWWRNVDTAKAVAAVGNELGCGEGATGWWRMDCG
jgi:NDP-sugar pyrophosphorylase family protein